MRDGRLASEATAPTAAGQSRPAVAKSRQLILTILLMIPLCLVFGSASLYGIGIEYRSAPALWLTGIGYALAIVGILWELFHPELGITLVAVGLLLVISSGGSTDYLAYFAVCHQSWFISAYSRRRKFWVSLLLIGSLLYIFMAAMPQSWQFLPWQNTGNSEVVGVNGSKDLTGFLMAMGGASLLAVLSIALFWQFGKNVRKKNETMENLRAKAELATVTERNRIAREMHDIVAHSLTVVIAQADGGRYAGRQDPAKAIEALDTIAERSREALAQMRGLLSVLRDDSLDRQVTTNPGAAGIADLCSDATRSGLKITLKQQGLASEIDGNEARGLTVYRIVQEALTNVLKHAGKVETTVNIQWGADAVTIAVDNAPGEHHLVDSDGRGQGLVGIKERVGVHNGTVTWGESKKYSGGWNLTATIPYR